MSFSNFSVESSTEMV